MPTALPMAGPAGPTAARTSRTPALAWQALGGMLLACVGLLGCGTEPPEPLSGLDPDCLFFDVAPYLRFDGSNGSILTGHGWSSPQADGSPAEGADPYCFALEGRCTVWVPPPAGAAVDLVARCRPFTVPDGPAQQVTLWHGERRLGEARLEDGWQMLRLSLPDGLFTRAWTELELRFSRAASPREVFGVADDRRLSVAFETLAVVPRSLPTDQVRSFVRGCRVDRETGALHLRTGAAAAYPLRLAAPGHLDLGEVSGVCAACTLSVQLQPADGAPQDLWTSPANQASGLGLSLPGLTGRLRFVASCQNDHEIVLSVPSGGLRGPVERSEGLPHVFLYLIDTLRADALQAYGNTRPTSPRLQAFAEEAVVYERAWSSSAWTVPATASFLTGRYHAAQGDVSEVVPNASAQLGPAGYASLAISQSNLVTGELGFDRGFDRFLYSGQLNEAFLGSRFTRTFLTGWLAWRPDPATPLLCYVHTVEPHSPYAPLGEDRSFARDSPGRVPAGPRAVPSLYMLTPLGRNPAEVAHLRALYEGEVRHADRQFGLFLDLLRRFGLYENSLIVLASDHGEEFGEHASFGHGATLYEEMLHVPLVVRYPHGRWAGRRVEERVSLVDVLPTVLAVAGVEASSPLDGRPLPPLSAPAPGRALFADLHMKRMPNRDPVDYLAAVLGDAKTVYNLRGADQFGSAEARWRFFDLGADPGEQRPLGRPSLRAVAARQALLEWSNATRTSREGASTWAEDPEHADLLRAMGYTR